MRPQLIGDQKLIKPSSKNGQPGREREEKNNHVFIVFRQKINRSTISTLVSFALLTSDHLRHCDGPKRESDEAKIDQADGFLR